MKAALGVALGTWLLAGAALAQADAGISLPPEVAPQDAGTPVPVAPGPPEAGAIQPVPAQPQPEVLAPPAPKAPRRRRHRGPDRSMNTLSVNLIRPFFFEFSGSLERAMTDLFSLNLDVTYAFANRASPRGVTTVAGFSFAGNARFFLLGKAPSGLFVGPDLEVLSLTVRQTFGEAAGTTFGIGAEAGYAIVLWKYLYLSASAGAEGLFGYVAYSGALPRGIGWAPILKANAGVAF